jgi:hypothetical protein
MMGITPEIEDLEKFPELNSKNTKDITKNSSSNIKSDQFLSTGNIKKILKN